MKCLVQAVLTSATNQAVASGTNFLIGVILVRHLSKEGFGAYGLAFAALLLAFNAGEALFMTPMTLEIARAPRDEVGDLVKSAFGGAVAVSGLISVPLALVWAVTFRASWGESSVVATTGALALAAFFFVLKESLLRIGYATRREGVVLGVNLSFAVTVLAVLLLPSTRPTTAAGAVSRHALAGAVSCAAAVAMLGVLRGRMDSPFRTVRRLAREGRWFLGSNAAYWLRLQAPTLVATWTLGVASVGTLNAGRLLVTPPVMLNPALGQVALPRLARLAGEKDLAPLFRAVLLFALTLALASASYCAVLWVWLEDVSQLMLGPGSGVPRGVVGGWCVFVIAQAFRNGAEVWLKSRGRARQLLVVNTAAVAAAVPLFWVGSFSGGEQGLLLAAATAELVVVVLVAASGALSRVAGRVSAGARVSVDGE